MRFLNIEQMLAMLLLTDNKPYITVKPAMGFPPIVAFTGTRNARDLMDDLRYSGQKWPLSNREYGMVHGGFARRTIRLIKDPILSDFIDTYDDFVLTGHSLGAGVCVLLASKLISEDKNVQSVYTFGSPTIGDDDFCHVYKNQNLWERTTRYVTPKDPVSKYIPVYKHLGNEKVLPFNGISTWEHHDISTYNSLLQNQANDKKITD